MAKSKKKNEPQEEQEMNNRDQILEGEIVEEGSDGDAVSLEEARGPENVAALQEELNAAQAKADEYLDGWQRSLAEFANYKKRVERDKAQVYQQATGSIVKPILQVVDDLERALKNKPQSGEGLAWAGGIELIYRKLISMLEAEGIHQMDAEGQMFDPNLHEAITSEDSPDHESGEIIEVVQKGYLQGDRVLRPAMVRVAQ